jgi:hypothetical protein
VRGYVNLLGPVIGEAAASTFRLFVETYLTAAERQQRLIAGLAAQPSLDEENVKVLAQGQVDTETAQAALLEAEATVKALLDDWRG